MSWIRRLRDLPLRGKVTVTFIAVVALALGVSTFLSFRYWEREFLAASEQQAALAAASTRAALESTLGLGQVDAGRRSLSRVVSGAPVSAARVYRSDHTVLLSSDPAEEGDHARGLWIPAPNDIPRDGILKPSTSGDTVRVFLPLSLNRQGEAVLELVLPVASTRAAMERGALLGHGLMLVSFLVLGVIVVTMLEREVLHPLGRMQRELGDDREPGPDRGANEVQRLQTSVQRLLEREREVEALAARRDRELEAREGLAQVGEMAAEMAHEFKRPLASIRSAVDLLEQEYTLERGGREVLDEVDHQLARLSETMKDLFTLARPVAMELEPVQVEELVDDVLMELRALKAAEQVRMERRYAPDLPPVPADRHRLEQAVLNVAANAVEAMPHGGTLTVAVDQADDGVHITISDTGQGIPPQEIERALRPFYSTKPLGTGLGLPLVARIVAAHRGSLDLRSTPGRGTTVEIVLTAGIREPVSTNPWAPNASSSSTTTA